MAVRGRPSYGGVLPTITIPAGMQVQSAMFTNTTYAALSMLDGTSSLSSSDLAIGSC